MALKAVAFDYSVLLGQNEKVTEELRHLIEQLKALDQKICVFSTHDRNINGALQKAGLPPVDHVVTESIVGIAKGSHKWIESATRLLGIDSYELMYVGDEARDFWTASNAAVFYLHAGWAGRVPEPGYEIAIPRVKTPRGILRFASHFLLHPPRWAYTLDVEEYGVKLRCLADAGISLPRSRGVGSFRLQDVLSHNMNIKVGNQNAQTLLVLHALSSLSLEGLFPRNSVIGIYPSSQPGMVSEVIESFLKPISSAFHAYYKRDLLIRAIEAPNTSDVRAAKKHHLISFLTQANTVCLNPEYESLARDKTIIVFDDFTTTGRSLEWARNLLYAAGAAQVVLLTIGKYRYNHDVYIPNGELASPFEIHEYDHSDFSRVSRRVRQHDHTGKVLKESFKLWITGEPYL